MAASDYNNRVEQTINAWLGRPATSSELFTFADEYQSIDNFFDSNFYTYLLEHEENDFLWVRDDFDTDYDGDLDYEILPVGNFGDIVTDMYARLSGGDIPQVVYDFFVGRLSNGYWGVEKLATKMMKSCGFWANEDGTFGTPPNFADKMAINGYTFTSADIPAADTAAAINKVEAGNAFTAALDTAAENNAMLNNPAAGADWLADVTDDASLATALAGMDAYIAEMVTPTQDGTVFNLASADAAGADVMRLTGDMTVRIDFTDPTNQIKGMDLDGDGLGPNGIETDGVENNITGVASGFEIVDAYSRNPLNTSDRVNNYLGNIYFDGTGWEGDGVHTDGNIFLGGLGADEAHGGIGNDFLAGDTSDSLYGGRNADFFFWSDQGLDGGPMPSIDGGATTDDSAVVGNTLQDADWLLFEGSDDYEPYSFTLEVGNEIEHFDASGNLYGFLDDVDVAIGENGQRAVTDFSANENVGIGSSAQIGVTGSIRSNIIIGGYDNDSLDGFAGNDLLMGGNLNYLNNPNMLNIVNNGMDEMDGGVGDDDIVFEVDGGTITGNAGTDTLWLTREAFGMQTSALTTDGTLRFDLEAEILADSEGYGGADAADARQTLGGTQDQSNYVNSSSRVDVEAMENVIATGLGAVDYLAAGTNNPELLFNNQQNHRALGDVNLDLRGYNTANTLYADAGDDVIEGRSGDDLLSGGEGNDDFVFWLNVGSGDDVDVIHRQTDDVNNATGVAGPDNIWDVDADGNVMYGQDFGVDSTSAFGPSNLSVDFALANLADANVWMSSFSVSIGGTTFAVTDTAALNAATTVAQLAALANTAFNAQDANVTVTSSGTVLTITDATPTGGRDISDTAAEGYAVTTSVTAPGTSTLGLPVYVAPGETVSEDRLIYVSYEDENDGELVDDGATTGSSISLGVDSYAEDLVIDFAADGTRIAEDQVYTLVFDNLTTEDTVALNVNGVTYTLTVGVDLDGNELAEEELFTQGGSAADQAELQHAFIARLSDFINTFMDNDTAAGSVLSRVITDAAVNTSRAIDLNADGDFVDVNIGTDANADEPAGADLIVGLTLTQNAYNTEETVFMRTPVVTITNGSGGQSATVAVTNVSQHEVHLLDFDGRDGNLDAANVVFVGNTDISRAILETGDTAGGALAGSEALLIDGGTNTLAATVTTSGAVIADNTATNSLLRTDFAVHGDDFLIGGAGLDTITAGTGDDRVHGSLGADVIDGGKSFYSVKVLGEAQSRVYVMNEWEASNPTQVAALAGLTISAINRIDQVEDDGTTAPVNVGTAEVFNDTLQFQQGDFTTNATRFTVTLTDTTMVAGVLQARTGGTGTVGVDTDGNGTIESTTSFTNFENIRTISGTGNAVAGDGQGNDTLNVTAMSTATGGISYDLTNRADVAGTGTGAGKVSYSVVGAISAAPVSADYDEMIIKVDGVESVISGIGTDLLMIDETEAAKNNTFNAGIQAAGQSDRIEYLNDYGTDDAEPMVTIKVNAAADTDTVVMTAGRVGSTVATDTLVGVERIALANNTAQGMLEDDVLDVTMLTTGAIVDYALGTVSTTAGVLQVTIEGISEIENVWADGDDTVVVADGSALMSAANARSDTDGTDEVDMAMLTYLDYDTFDAGNDRIAFNEQTTAQIEDVLNFGQYTFDLSHTGDGNDVDRVDYRKSNDQIVAVVDLNNTDDTNYVLVSADGKADDSFEETADRVDVLIDVEAVVASQGESVLDLTSAETNLNIRYSKILDGTDRADFDSTETVVTIENRDTSVPYTGFSYIELYDNDTPLDLTGINAQWTRIEGSDADEYVELTSDQNPMIHTFNLRGGANEANYNELQSTGIELSIQDVDTTVAGFTSVNIQSKDNTGTIINAGDVSGDGIINGVEVWTDYDSVTSYNGFNDTSAGSLRIEASQSADDSINLASLVSNNLIVVGETEGLDDLVRVQIGGALDAGLELTGFETLIDGGGNDEYRIEDLSNFLDTMQLTDVAGDSDTVVLTDGALESSNGVVWNDDTIELDTLEDAADGTTDTIEGFDFDTLDISEVTEQIDLVDTNDAGETLILGSLANFADLSTAADDVQGFEIIKFTSTTGMGTDVVVDMDLGEFRQADGTVLFEFDSASTFDFSAITSNMTVTVVDVGGAGVTIVGDAVDTFTGSNGDDILVGGADDDTLDGGVIAAVAPIVSYDLNGGAAALAADGNKIAILGVTVEADNNASVVASAINIAVVVGADSDVVGGSFAGVSLATWKTQLAADATFQAANGGTLLLATAAAANLESVTYDATLNRLLFTFNNTAQTIDQTDFSAATVTGGTITATLADAQLAAVQVDSADIYVIGTADGDDTILNWDTTDSIYSDLTYATGVDYLEDVGGISADYAEASAAATAAFTGNADLDIFFAWDANNGYVFTSEGQVITLDGAIDTDIAAVNIVVATALGTAGPDVFAGTGADELFYGFAGTDVIDGDAGADMLVGGAGTDYLTGGTGIDTFSMVAADAGDTITDFTVAADLFDYNTALLSINGAVTTPVGYQAAAAGVALGAGTTVFELTGATTDGTAADLVTTLAATAVDATIDAGDTMLFVNYLATGGAQVWSFVDASGADVSAGELTLVATLTGVAADALTTANFI